MQKTAEMDLPRNTRVANKYNRVVDDVRKKIISGEYVGMLPGAKLLADVYGVSLMTANKAINVLARERVVVRLPRKGTLVNPGMQAKKETFAIVVRDMMLPLTSRVVGEFGKMAREEGILTFFSQHFNDEKKEEAIVRELAAGNTVDGVVMVLCSQNESGAAIKLLGEAKIPVVVLDLTPFSKTVQSCHVISFDERAAFKKGTLHLLKLGHSKVALVSPHNVDGLPMQEEYHKGPRFLGYAEAMQSMGLIPQPPVWFNTDKALDPQEITRFIKHIKPYTALFLNHDAFAVTVLATLHRAGIHVPNDLSLVSYDGSPLAGALDLTTLSLPMEQVAHKAIEILRGCKKGLIRKPVQEVFEATINVRGSVAPMGSRTR